MKKFTFLLAAMLAAAVSQAQVYYDNCRHVGQPVYVNATGDAQLHIDTFQRMAVSTNQSISSYYFLQSGGNTYTYNCTDTGTIAIIAVGSLGDQDTCYSNANTISVQDSFAPTAHCQNITVTLSSAQSVTIAALDLDNGSTDNCNLTYGIVTNGAAPSTKTYTAAGVYNETLRVSDRGMSFYTPLGNRIIYNTDSCAATVTVLAAPIAVTVYEAAQTVRIMPNPFDGVVRVELATAISENQSISLYSLDGRLVQQAEIPANTNIFELNTVELPTGVYVLQLRNSAFQLSERIIKH